MDNNLKTYRDNELVIRFFARSNPVLFRDVFRHINCQDSEYAGQLAEEVKADARQVPFAGNDKGRKALEEIYGAENCPTLSEQYHIIPVWNSALNAAFMLPFSIEPADEWHVPDIFNNIEKDAGNPTDFLMKHLEYIERAWKHSGQSRQLPLRWRRAFSIKPTCPVPRELIEGDSLILPFIMGLMRSFGSGMDTMEQAAVLPFGNRPLFATGRVCHDKNSFDNVGHVEEKAKGFLREYGPDMPAVLMSKQKEQLEKAGLLQHFSPVIEADSISDLLARPEIKEGMDLLCDPPHPTEIDALLATMDTLTRSIRFRDVSVMVKWLIPGVESPIYRFHLLRKEGLMFAHDGKFVEAHVVLQKCYHLFEEHPDVFSIHDRCDLATMAGTAAFDAAEPDKAYPLLGKVHEHLEYLPIKERTALWGTYSQLWRLDGRYRKAVEAGREAVKCADMARASESGRDRNYLIHALLAMARHKQGTEKQHLLDDAEKVLDESKDLWTPRDNSSNRRSHLGFCLHYQAELAKLRQHPFNLPVSPPWQGHWGHPWYFAMLSCARNQAHDLEARQELASRLVKKIGGGKKPPHPASLFYMFWQVYRIYEAFLLGKSCPDAVQALDDWCTGHARSGCAGWQKRLSPYISRLHDGDIAAAEELCDAVPYH